MSELCGNCFHKPHIDECLMHGCNCETFSYLDTSGLSGFSEDHWNHWRNFLPSFTSGILVIADPDLNHTQWGEWSLGKPPYRSSQCTCGHHRKYHHRFIGKCNTSDCDCEEFVRITKDLSKDGE